MKVREFLELIGGEERLIDACNEDYVGFCVDCGAEVYGVEPDARRYQCDVCGAFRVYGAEEIAMRVFA